MILKKRAVEKECKEKDFEKRKESESEIAKERKGYGCPSIVIFLSFGHFVGHRYKTKK